MALTDGIENKLKNIADAIRLKTNKMEKLTPEQMASEIENLDKNNPLVNAIENSTIFSDTDKQNLKELALNTASNADDIVYYTTNLEEHHGIIIVTDKSNLTPYDNCFLDCDILVLDYKGGLNSSNAGCFNSNCKYIYLLSDLSLSRGGGASCFSNTNLIKIIQNGHKITLTYNDYFSMVEMFRDCYNLEELPEFTLSDNYIDGYSYYVFSKCKKLKKITSKNIPHLKSSYSSAGESLCPYCFSLEIFELYTTINRGTVTFRYCQHLHTIGELDLLNCTGISSMFTYCFSLVNVSMLNWRQYNLSFADSPNLSIDSINRLIENCDKDGGTQVARTLTLHATAGARWADETQNPRYTELLTKANQCLIEISY